MAGFKKAVKSSAKLRMALAGPAGSGKTYTALTLATALANGGQVAVIDTEHGSASKYADLFEFDVLELDDFHPHKYLEAIQEAASAGYAVVVIDSLSHAWMGKGGILEIVQRNGNSIQAWAKVKPIEDALKEGMIAARIHVIATMRTKTEYVVESNEKGKAAPRKVGMAPVQREGMEYEFDVFGELDQENTLTVQKTRCPAIAGAVISKPGKPLADTLGAWLNAGGEPAQVASVAPVTPIRQEQSAKQWTEDERRQLRDRWYAVQLDKPGMRTPERYANELRRFAGKDARQLTNADRDRFEQHVATLEARKATPRTLGTEVEEFGYVAEDNSAELTPDPVQPHDLQELPVDGIGA